MPHQQDAGGSSHLAPSCCRTCLQDRFSGVVDDKAAVNRGFYPGPFYVALRRLLFGNGQILYVYIQEVADAVYRVIGGGVF